MIKLADGRGSLYQWDTGRQVECDAEQVHFSNHHYGTSIDVDVQNGKATIPNQLLTSATPIKAWAWVKDSNGEYTKEEQIFLVAKRNKPSDYVYTPAEIKTWQDLQNQIGDLNNLTTTHKDNLVNAINDAAGSGGGGAGDFIIKMTVESNGDGNYTVISCDATVEQIDAAVAAEKRVILIATQINSGLLWEMPIVQGSKGNFYYFGTFLQGKAIAAFVLKDGDESGWLFVITQIKALDVDYSNNALPGISTVDGALNVLVPNSHTHNNKDTLDKLSVSNGKLQYNGSDVGLKGDKGDPGKDGVDGSPGAAGADGVTPHIGDNGNWFIGSTDTGKPSRGEKGDPGKDGVDGSPGAAGADGVTPTIGDNGNWFIGNTDTGKPSRGADGAKGVDGTDGKDGANGKDGTNGITPRIGTNGNWYLGDTDTGKPSRGDKGDRGADGKDGTDGSPGADGVTPAIGENGNWFVGNTDTGKPSRGEKGDPGKDGVDGSPGAAGADGVTPHIGDNGNWYIGNTDTGKPSRGVAGARGDTGATGADGKTPVKGTDYWTAADKQEIVNDVIAALPDGTEVSY